jgi:hypothetical protein
MTFLEEKVTRLTASLMTVQGFDERIESFQTQANLMEDRVSNLGRAVRRNARLVQSEDRESEGLLAELDRAGSLSNVNERLESVEDKASSTRRDVAQLKQKSQNLHSRNADVEANMKGMKESLESDMANMKIFLKLQFETFTKTIDNRLNQESQERLRRVEEIVAGVKDEFSGKFNQYKTNEAERGRLLLMNIKNEHEKFKHGFEADMDNAFKTKIGSLLQENEKSLLELKTEIGSTLHNFRDALHQEQNSQSNRFMELIHTENDKQSDKYDTMLEEQRVYFNEVVLNNDRKLQDFLKKHSTTVQGKIDASAEHFAARLKDYKHGTDENLKSAQTSTRRELEAMKQSNAEALQAYENQLLESANDHRLLSSSVATLGKEVGRKLKQVVSDAESARQKLGGQMKDNHGSVQRTMVESDSKMKLAVAEAMKQALKESSHGFQSEVKALHSTFSTLLEERSKANDRRLKSIEDSNEKSFESVRSKSARGDQSRDRKNRELFNELQERLDKLTDLQHHQRDELFEFAKNIEKGLENKMVELKTHVGGKVRLTEKNSAKRQENISANVKVELKKQIELSGSKYEDQLDQMKEKLSAEYSTFNRSVEERIHDLEQKMFSRALPEQADIIEQKSKAFVKEGLENLKKETAQDIAVKFDLAMERNAKGLVELREAMARWKEEASSQVDERWKEIERSKLRKYETELRDHGLDYDAGLKEAKGRYEQLKKDCDDQTRAFEEYQTKSYQALEEQERKHAKRLQSQKEQLDSQREQHDGELRNLQLEMDRYRKAHQEQFDRHREEHEGELRAVRTSLEREMDKHREAQQQELVSHRGKHDDNLRSVHAILKQNKLEQEDQRKDARRKDDRYATELKKIGQEPMGDHGIWVETFQEKQLELRTKIRDIATETREENARIYEQLNEIKKSCRKVQSGKELKIVLDRVASFEEICDSKFKGLDKAVNQLGKLITNLEAPKPETGTSMNANNTKHLVSGAHGNVGSSSALAAQMNSLRTTATSKINTMEVMLGKKIDDINLVVAVVRRECKNDVKAMKLELDRIASEERGGDGSSLLLTREQVENKMSSHRMGIEKNVSASIKHIVLKMKQDLKRESASVKADIAADLRQAEGKILQLVDTKVIAEVYKALKGKTVSTADVGDARVGSGRPPELSESVLVRGTRPAWDSRSKRQEDGDDARTKAVKSASESGEVYQKRKKSPKRAGARQSPVQAQNKMELGDELDTVLDEISRVAMIVNTTNAQFSELHKRLESNSSRRRVPKTKAPKGPKRKKRKGKEKRGNGLKNIDDSIPRWT